MYNLSVRNIDDGVITKLKQTAKRRNMSLESLAHSICVCSGAEGGRRQIPRLFRRDHTYISKPDQGGF